MKKIYLPLASLLILIGISSSSVLHKYETAGRNNASVEKYNYTEKWRIIDSLEAHGLPKTALPFVNEVYRYALLNSQTDHLIRAIIYQMKFYHTFQPDYYIESIQKLEERLDEYTMPEKALLESMLAEMYWKYSLSRGYITSRHSTSNENKNSNPETWSHEEIINMSRSYYLSSIAQLESLSDISTHQLLQAVLKPSQIDAESRPTLYDFLAFRAIDFLSSPRATHFMKSTYFDVSDPSYYSLAKDFTALEIQDTAQQESISAIILKIYQKLALLHLRDGNKEALFEAETEKLDFLNTLNPEGNTSSVYFNALNNLENNFKSCPGCIAEVKLRKAKFFWNAAENNVEVNSSPDSLLYRKAYDLTLEIEASPDSLPTYIYQNCETLQKKITERDLSVQTKETLIPDQENWALVSFKNVDSLYIRILKTHKDKVKRIQSMAQEATRRQSDKRSFAECLLDTLQTETPIEEVSYYLTNNKRFRQQTQEVKIPALPAGDYIIMAGSDRMLNSQTEEVVYCYVKVSAISYVIRSVEHNKLELYVFDRKTGVPAENLDVHVFTSAYNFSKKEQETKKLGTYPTDENGYSHFHRERLSGRWYFEIIDGNDTLSNLGIDKRYPDTYNFHNPNQKSSQQYTVSLFTDRAIYRPGQTVHFKGIAYKTDGLKDHSPATSFVHTVRFTDPFRKEIDKTEVKTNEYGSYSGSFLIPHSTANGQMSITTHYGSTFIRVEEYKRPTFEVKIQSPEKEFSLGEEVSIKGVATHFSGAPVESAKVKYKIERNASFGYWEFYNPSFQYSLIDNGEITTNAQGEFTIKFEAKPDLSQRKNQNSFYNFKISADVTDLNGETQSGDKSIRISDVSLIADLKIPAFINKKEPVDFAIHTTNLEGEFQSVKGKLTVHRLKPRENFTRVQWSDPQNTYPQSYNYNNPYQEYPINSIPEDQEDRKDQLLLSRTLTTRKDSAIVLDRIENWKSGEYLIQFQSVDAKGNEISVEKIFLLYSLKDKTPPVPSVSYFQLLSNEAEPGDKVTLLLGSSLQNQHFILETEQNGKILDRQYIVIDSSLKTIKIPIQEEHRGNLSVHCITVREGILYNHTRVIKVPYSNKYLDLQFETFRNKLHPGDEEEWKIKIRDKEGKPVSAEMLATLYDASLDEIVPHRFNFNLHTFFRPTLRWKQGRGFETKEANRVRWDSHFYLHFSGPKHDELNWFHYRPGYYPMIVNYDQAYEVKHGSIVVVSKKPYRNAIVRGKVKTLDGTALAGVNISVVGTELAYKTDKDGNFDFSLDSAECKLDFSHEGYLTESIRVDGKTTLDVIMAEDVMNLEEVVVVGYGVQKKSDLTGAVSSIPMPPTPGVQIVDDLEIDFEIFANEEVEEEEVFFAVREQALDGYINFKQGNGNNTVKLRKNFNETALFEPHLRTNAKGEIFVNFKIPESLTRWKMLGIAHTRELAYGQIENELVTSKELMVIPNIPRFFRENDTLILVTKISNLTMEKIDGHATLQLFNASDRTPINHKLLLSPEDQTFDANGKGSTTAKWKITVPVGTEALTVRISASANVHTDGVEMTIPVLSSRILVTETLPIWSFREGKEEYRLENLVKGKTSTQRNHKLTFEYTANPAWMVVQSLPYLIEYPYDCMEQTFSKYYGNAIGSHIINSNPRIKEVFKHWVESIDSNVFISALERNPELKQIALEETPWLMDAKSEQEEKRKLARLFDEKNIESQQRKLIEKLDKGQNSDGGFPWFAGGSSSTYITQYVLIGFGHLSKMGIDYHESNKLNIILRSAIRYLDNELAGDYINLQKRLKDTPEELKNNQLSYSAINYLYCRSFYQEIPISQEALKAVHYYKKQSELYWASQRISNQALIALSAFRDGQEQIPGNIIKSLREKAISDDKEGMRWTYSNRISTLPVELHARLIEMFAEIDPVSEELDLMKLWLIRHKQLNNWHTTKGTAEACYALLMHGSKWINTSPSSKIEIGNWVYDYSETQVSDVALGQIKHTWTEEEITRDKGIVTLSKKDNIPGFGSLHWQYFENIDKVQSTASGLSLSKQFYVEKIINNKVRLYPITASTNLKVGDKVVVRLIIESDRDMDYMHLKDLRPSGTEPYSILSRHKYTDGLYYYQETKDASVNFFIEHLRAGTYVLEYSLKTSHSGNFSGGFATIQCMYSPEFTARSAGNRISISGN